MQLAMQIVNCDMVTFHEACKEMVAILTNKYCHMQPTNSQDKANNWNNTKYTNITIRLYTVLHVLNYQHCICIRLSILSTLLKDL